MKSPFPAIKPPWTSVTGPEDFLDLVQVHRDLDEISATRASTVDPKHLFCPHCTTPSLTHFSLHISVYYCFLFLSCHAVQSLEKPPSYTLAPPASLLMLMSGNRYVADSSSRAVTTTASTRRRYSGLGDHLESSLSMSMSLSLSMAPPELPNQNVWTSAIYFTRKPISSNSELRKGANNGLNLVLCETTNRPSHQNPLCSE